MSSGSTSSASDRHLEIARRVASIAIVVLLALVCWMRLVSPERAAVRVPGASEVETAAARVIEGFRRGDVVRVHPWWWLAPRRVLAGPSRSPVADLLGGIRIGRAYEMLDLRGRADPLHLLRYRRLWVIAAFEDVDADDSVAVGLPLEEIGRWDGERLRVSLYTLPPSPIRYDLLRHLDRAQVRRGNRRCRWQAEDRRHHCGEQPWKDVYVALKEVGDATRTCIYAEPHPADTPLTIRYPQAIRDGTLVLHTGFSIEGARRTAGADTRVRVSLDDRLVAEWVEPRNDFVWRRTTVPGDGTLHDIVIELSAPEVGWRQLCYDGAVVAPQGMPLLAR